MAIGDYRLSSETTRPVPQRGGGAAEGVMAIARSAATHGLRPVERTHVPGGNEQFYRGVGRRIGAALDERDEREAADAALALQRELSERELAMYQKRGTDAGEYAAPDEETEYGRGFGNGVATQWSEAAVQRFDEVSAELSPGVRKRLAERMRPWMEAHRIGLLRHQMNEARSGERDRVMEGIGMRSATEAATAAARLAAIGRDGGQAPRTPGQGGATWDADVDAALAQAGVISETGALDDLDRATRRGVFTDEEARDIRRKNSANTIKALVGTLLESGSDSVAEAVIDRVSEGSEDEDGRETASIAAENGIGPEEIARWRGMVKTVRDRKEREARQAVGREFTEKELGLRDVPQELWADAYEAMGKDETLRRTDPRRAMAYMDTANEMRAAERAATEREAKAKEKATADAIKGNEENLARSLATLDLLKTEGSLSQDAANDAQAALWRKYRTLALGNGISPSFMQSFRNRLETRLTAQESNAMRKFYRAFGFSAELDNGGEPTATARKEAKKDSENYYAPLEEDGVRLESRKTRVKAADLLAYGDTLLRTLRALGPDMNREGVVDREIARLKTGWIKGELDKNRDATVRSVMGMQREARTRWEMAQPEKTSGEGDDGRKEDGKPAK